MKLAVSTNQLKRKAAHTSRPFFSLPSAHGKTKRISSNFEEATFQLQQVQRTGPQTLVIEADIGMGKSHAISVVASRLNPARVVVAAGNPFAVTEDDFAWSDLLSQMIDAEVRSVQSQMPSQDEQEREIKLNGGSDAVRSSLEGTKAESTPAYSVGRISLASLTDDLDCRSAIVLAAVREDALFSNSNSTNDGAMTALEMMYNGPRWLRDAVKFDISGSTVAPESLLPLLNDLLGTNFDDTAESRMYSVRSSDIESMVHEYLEDGYVHCINSDAAMSKFARMSSERVKLANEYRDMLTGCALQCARWQVQLVLMVTNVLCRLWPHAILVDDIMYLDRKSW